MVKKKRVHLPSFFLFYIFEFSGSYKTAIEDRFVLSRKIGITPIFELLYFVCYQHFDSLAQLFLKKPRIETHPGKDVFYVTKHLHSKKYKV